MLCSMEITYSKGGNYSRAIEIATLDCAFLDSIICLYRFRCQCWLAMFENVYSVKLTLAAYKERKTLFTILSVYRDSFTTNNG